MFAQALQQHLGLVERVFGAAAHRAGLAAPQLLTQGLDRGVAGQPLALQQLARQVQCLLGAFQLSLGGRAFADQALALDHGLLLTFTQGGLLLMQLKHAGVYKRQLLHGAMLLAVVLQHAAEQVDLFCQGVGLRLGFPEQGVMGVAFGLKVRSGLAGLSLQAGQFLAAFAQAAADQHHLLELRQIGMPRAGQPGQVLAVGQRRVDLGQLLLTAFLAGVQLLQLLLGLSHLMFGLLAVAALDGQLLIEPGQVVLGREGLTQQGTGVAMGGLGGGQRKTGCFQRLLLLGRTLLQLGELPGVFVKFGGDRRALRCQCLLAVKLMALRGKTLKARQVQARLGQGLPVLLGSPQGSAGLRVLGLKLLLLDQPAALLLQLSLASLVGFELVLRLFQALVQFGAGVYWHGQQVASSLFQGGMRLAGLAGSGKRPLAQPRIDRGVGQFLQQFAALAVVGFEKRAELALRQHHGAGELFEVKAQARLDQLLVFVLAAAQHLLAVQVVEALAAELEFAIGLLAGAVRFPARPVAAPVHADEIHLGKATAGTAAQQVARVRGGYLAIAVRHLGLTADVIQAWHRTEQRQAQRVEQGAFTRPRGAGDGKQTRACQGLLGEVDIDRARQRCQVLQANGKNLHGCSSSCCTSCSSRAKSASVCSSAGSP